MGELTLREPKPAQVKAMQYAFPKARIALFMQMRLGKNLVTIRWARHHKLNRVLVVAPNDVLDEWQRELILEQVPSHDIYVLDGSKTDKLLVAHEADTGWVLVNYEALRDTRYKNRLDRTGAHILRQPWNGIILDESTHIRNPKAQTTKTLLRETGHIVYRAILTGLPNPQSHMDYFCQLAFINGTFMGYYNYWAWRHALFIEPSGQWDFEWKPKPGAQEQIKNAVHKIAFFMTRKQAGLGEQRVIERRHIKMTPKQRIAYRQVEKEFAYGTIETNWVPVKTVWLERIAGGFSPDQEKPECLNDGKIKTIVYLLQTELRNEPVVIWFRFNQELRAVAAALKEKKITFTTIIGGKKRADIVERKRKFQDGKVQVILMQMKMGKYGWDLSRADTEIRYSETFDFEEFSQSRDRIVSVQKHVPLLSISLVTRDTIDEDKIDILNDKRVTAQTFNLKLRERIKSSWLNRYGFTLPEEKIRRVMPGDRPE